MWIFFHLKPSQSSGNVDHRRHTWHKIVVLIGCWNCNIVDECCEPDPFMADVLKKLCTSQSYTRVSRNHWINRFMSNRSSDCWMCVRIPTTTSSVSGCVCIVHFVSGTSSICSLTSPEILTFTAKLLAQHTLVIVVCKPSKGLFWHCCQSEVAFIHNTRH